MTPRRWLLAGLVLVAGCGGPVEPDLGTIVYGIFSGCAVDPAGPYACSPNQTVVARGDTLLIGHAVVDTADDTGTLSHVTIRAPCAVHFEIWRHVEIVGTLPAEPTCPDSTLSQGVNAPRILNLTFFLWPVSADLEPGTYVFHSLWLENPKAERTIEITVR